MILHRFTKIKLQKSVALVYILSGIFATTASAQVVYIDSISTSIIHDKYGNVLYSNIYMEVSYEAKLEALYNYKIKYFNRHIGLTHKDAMAFWPIYDEYSRKKEELKNHAIKLLQQLTSPQTINTISDAETKGLLDSYMITVEKETYLLVDYYKKFLEIMPAKKVAKVYQTEKDFQNCLLQLVKNGGYY